MSNIKHDWEKIMPEAIEARKNGMSFNAFAKSRGINPNTFGSAMHSYRMKHGGKAPASKPSNGFIPYVPATQAQIEIKHKGMTISVPSIDMLKQVITALGGE